MRCVVLIGLLPLLALSACSLDTFDGVDACTTDSECESAFETGYICNSGRCELKTCTADAECENELGLGATCEAQRCVALVCSTDAICETTLGAGHICDTASERCVRASCQEDADCTGDPAGPVCGDDSRCGPFLCSSDADCAARADFGFGHRCEDQACVPTSCQTDAECRDSVGFGAVCADMQCGLLSLDARCSTLPEDLLSNPERYPGALAFGTLFDETPNTGKDLANAVAQAVLEVDDLQDSLLPHVGLVRCNVAQSGDFDGLDEEQAVKAMATLLTDRLGVSGIVGPASTTPIGHAFEVTGPADAVLMVPASRKVTVREMDERNPSDEMPGLIWRTATAEDLQGFAAAQLLVDGGAVTEVAVIHDGSVPALRSGQRFAERFDGGGRSSTPHSFTRGDAASRQSVASTVAGEVTAPSGAIALFTDDEAEALAMLEALAAEAALDGITVVTGEALSSATVIASDNADLRTRLLPTLRGLRLQGPDDAAASMLGERILSNFDLAPTASAFFTQAYDAGWLLFYAALLRRLDSQPITGTGLAQALRKLSEGSPIPFGATAFTAARQALDNVGNIDVAGISGPLDFDPATEEPSAPYEVWKLSAALDAEEVASTLTP